MAACEIAGVEPKFEKINGHDPPREVSMTSGRQRPDAAKDDQRSPDAMD
jgi:hypothetical protein